MSHVDKAEATIIEYRQPTPPISDGGQVAVDLPGGASLGLIVCNQDD
jgi:hypothetical protein